MWHGFIRLVKIDEHRSSFWVFQGGTFSLIYMKRPCCVILLISDGSVKQKTNSHNQRKKYKKAMPYQNFFFFSFVTFVSSFFRPKNVVTEFFLAVLVFFLSFFLSFFLLAESDLGSLFSRLMNRLHLMWTSVLYSLCLLPQVFFTWLDVAKRFSVSVRCFLWLVMLLSSQGFFFGLRISQTVVLASPKNLSLSVMGFFWFCSPCIYLFIYLFDLTALLTTYCGFTETASKWKCYAWNKLQTFHLPRSGSCLPVE